jgi:hypothetical protein
MDAPGPRGTRELGGASVEKLLSATQFFLWTTLLIQVKFAFAERSVSDRIAFA